MQRFLLAVAALAMAGPAPAHGLAVGGLQDTVPAAAARDSGPTVVAQRGVPVVLRGDTVLRLTQPLGAFTPEQRARAIQERVRLLARTPGIRTDSIGIRERAGASDIVVDDHVVATITEEDALAVGADRTAMAEDATARIGRALAAESWTSVVRSLAIGVLLTLLATAVFVALYRVLRATFPKVYQALEYWRGSKLPSLRLQKLELVSADRITDLLILLAKALYWVLLALLLYFYLPLVFSFFPWTAPLADRLLDVVITPFANAFRAILAYLPNLFQIFVIVVVTNYVLDLIHLVFRGIERGAISLKGFYPEWAEPTYKIARFLVLVFALILIWDKLPGSDSDAFAGVSVFVGVLVSLGSAGAIANIVAGLVITYMRPFKEGDRVRIADTEGDVIEKTLLVTRIRTTKNVDITVPNALVLGAHIINYSSSAEARGFILHTTVTIGYDVPWRRVHEALTAAARDTPDILPDPAPFVLQTALGDHAVAYQLNAYTNRPNRMAGMYSELHQAIQDRFNEAGIEIMSPAYTAIRDGNRIAIPDEHLPPGYEPPTFRVDAGS